MLVAALVHQIGRVRVIIEREFGRRPHDVKRGGLSLYIHLYILEASGPLGSPLGSRPGLELTSEKAVVGGLRAPTCPFTLTLLERGPV